MRLAFVVAVGLSLGLAGILPAEAHDPLTPTARIGLPRHQVHSHDSARVYRADGEGYGIRVLESGTSRVLREIVTDEPVDLVALSPDGRWLYGVSPRADHLLVIDVATERIIGRIPLASPRPGGRVIARGTD